MVTDPWGDFSWCFDFKAFLLVSCEEILIYPEHTGHEAQHQCPNLQITSLLAKQLSHINSQGKHICFKVEYLLWVRNY